MLFSGAAAVPSSASECLRCQLRCVLQHLRSVPSAPRRSHTPHRAFSTIYSQRAVHDGSAHPRAQKNEGVYYKHVGPNGRIVGKDGRKQRQTSEALATNSLGEKSEIVVFRDVPSTRKANPVKPPVAQYADFGEEGLKGLSLTAEEIQAAMAETGLTPDEKDVNTSIDALRPQAPVLEGHEFDRLIKELLDSYNMPQLSRYLRRSLASHSTSTTVVRQLEYSQKHPKGLGPRTISFTRSRWQPGRTPLDKRRISNIPPPRGASSSPKARAAERIVRVAWEVTTKSEEREMGELEVQMLPWALALFFDLASEGKPKYQTLIEPPMLLRNSEIRPYRPDGVIRITARRQDAEDIATQLETKVLLMGKQQLLLNMLISENDKKALAGNSLQMFTKEQLDVISQRTQSVFMQQTDGKVGIYSFKLSDRANARRLLLSLLDLASHNVKAMRLEPSQSMEDQQEDSASASLALLPIYPDRGLHFRDRSKVFVRATLPAQRKAIATPGVGRLVNVPKMSIAARAEAISRTLIPLTEALDERQQQKLTPAVDSSQRQNSLWDDRRFDTSSSWWVQLGLLLQESDAGIAGDLLKQNQPVDSSTSGKSKTSQKSVFLRQVPSYETMLSYFKPNERQASRTTENHECTSGTSPDPVARKSTIVAHFIPSPFAARGSSALALFPRLELTLLRKFGRGNEDGELRIESLRGITEEHIVDVPLPDQAIDVRLSRKVGGYANMIALNTNPQIREFVSKLNQSAKSQGALHGHPQLDLPMPGWMAKSDTATRKLQSESLPEISVPYIFERFEQGQNTAFRKNSWALSERSKHNAAIKLFNESFPQHARLEYNEIEAGDIGGRHTDISFKVQKIAPKENAEGSHTPATKETGSKDTSQPLSAVLIPALAIADFVTRTCRGEITPWRGAPGLARSESIEDEEPK